MNQLMLFFLLFGLANAQYVQPVWFERIMAEGNAIGENVQRCFKREDVPPIPGIRCARRPKTCYFGTQTCPGGLPHPITRCGCPGSPDRFWECAPAPCPNDGPDPPAVNVDLTLESNDVDIFPGYTGGLEPAGSVKVKFYEDDSMLFSYDMSGLPRNCIDCAVSIHAGVSCASADQVLGNYYDTTELSVDPWTLAANYSTDAHGDVKGFFHLSSGFNYVENIGHAVVFYDRDGSSISCGTLMTRDMMLKSDNIDIFPEYTGGFEPAGSVKVNFLQNETMLFSYDMAGLPSDCVECGVHIHSGVSCESADQVLGNFYDPSEPTVEADPWIPLLGASYSTNEKGEGKGCFSLFTGFNYQENIGHAVVFTDKSDTPIACGTLETLETTLEGDSIDVFPGYDGSLAPAGSVKADFHEDNSLLLSYDIAGLPANCIECGISIQTGATCAEDGALLGTTSQPFDVSNGTSYSTDATGDGKGCFQVPSDVTLAEGVTHAVVFHDKTGAQVGCGTLW